MKIAVFCSSRTGKDPAFAQQARELGRFLAAQGHTLIYGAEDCGLMKEVSNAMLDAGGEVIGYVPENVAFIVEGANPRLSELIFCKDMGARKSAMMHDADAFFALPGSVGTMDEFTEIMSLNKVGLMDKPVILIDTCGFYGPLKTFFANMVEEEIAGASDFRQVLITDSLEEAAAFLALHAPEKLN